MGALWFVTGGARSGKSRFAARLAATEAARHRPVVFIATMEPRDDELVARVARHRAERPAEWRTIEAPLDPASALRGGASEACALLDCVSLWVSNMLIAGLDARTGAGEAAPPAAEIPPAVAAVLESRLCAEVDALLAAVAARTGPTIAVSNEVGAGVVPPTPLGRLFRDLLGISNQRFGAAADRAWLLVAGRALELPPTEGP